MDSTTIRELTKSVSSYFLNHLETDFKKQQLSGRRLQLQREGGLRGGLSLSRYAPLNAAFWTALYKPASDLEPISVSRRAYTATLTDRFRDSVVKAVKGIPKKSMRLSDNKSSVAPNQPSPNLNTLITGPRNVPRFRAGNLRTHRASVVD